MHDVLYAHRLSFLTLRLFEQVLEEVRRTALASRLGMLCRYVTNIGNISTQFICSSLSLFLLFLLPVYDCFGRYRRYCGWILICLR